VYFNRTPLFGTWARIMPDAAVGRARARRQDRPHGLTAYPSLTRDDIRAALAYAAEITGERYVDVPIKTGA